MQSLRGCFRYRVPTIFYKYTVFLNQIHKPLLIRNSVRIKNFVSVSYSLNSANNVSDQLVDSATFEKVCEETLESLTEYFEQVVEESENFKAGDVSYSTGVLTINLGPKYGTYVINRQTPNRQIWLSSPTSGPKRYDFIVSDKCWVYKHDGQSLHELLQSEISKLAKSDVNFGNCLYARLVK